jgi:hypothetical protein
MEITLGAFLCARPVFLRSLLTFAEGPLCGVVLACSVAAITAFSTASYAAIRVRRMHRHSEVCVKTELIYNVSRHLTLDMTS